MKSSTAVSALVLGVLGILAAGCSPQGPAASADAPTAGISEEARRAVGTIDADFLSSRIREISDDAFEGRAPGTTGDQKARAWLVSQLKELGYSPGAADGTWEQPFDLVGVRTTLPAQMTFEGAGGKKLSLKSHDEYVGTSGVPTERNGFRNAEVVFVGYGIQAPEYQWDDYKGVDLKGKVLLMLNNDPDWDPALFAGPKRLWYGRWDYKYLSAARQGAAGAIIIHTTPSAGYPFQVVQTSWLGENFELPAGDEPRTQFKGWVTEDAAKSLAQFGGQDLAKLVESARSRDFRPVSLGVRTSLALQSKVNRISTANVIGVLPGSDAQLGHEAVVFTAHHDHLGVGEPDANGDRIYNGAFDNGAGVAQVLAFAKAFKALPTPPRRSIVMLFVAAEEQGLLGSQYYAEHPTFAPGRIAANFNFDGGNIIGKARDVLIVGHGKSSLDAVIDRAAASQGRVVKPEVLVDRGHFYRSDQFNFAKIGVPAFYATRSLEYEGKPAEWGKQQVEAYEEHHYHQPSDNFDPAWTYDGMLQDVQLVFQAGLEVANADHMPEWTPGDEFEATRKAAIAALAQ